MRLILIIGLYSFYQFGLSSKNKPISINEKQVNYFDTLEKKIIIRNDTDEYLIYLFESPYSCQPTLKSPNSLFYNNKFIDTSFDLTDEEVEYLKKSRPLYEFHHFSKYYRKTIVGTRNKKYKKKFKGFKFSVFSCKIIVNKKNYKTMMLNLPDNSKYLRSLRNAIYIDSVRILKE